MKFVTIQKKKKILLSFVCSIYINFMSRNYRQLRVCDLIVWSLLKKNLGSNKKRNL